MGIFSKLKSIRTKNKYNRFLEIILNWLFEMLLKHKEVLWVVILFIDENLSEQFLLSKNFSFHHLHFCCFFCWCCCYRGLHYHYTKNGLTLCNITKERRQVWKGISRFDHAILWYKKDELLLRKNVLFAWHMFVFLNNCLPSIK